MLTKSWLKVWDFLGMKENKEDIKLLLIMVFAGGKNICNNIRERNIEGKE